MKNILRNIFILFSPILLLVTVNEFSGSKDPNQNDKTKCTWACHNNTTFCKSNHVKVLKPYFKTTDKLYFGLISKLQQTGSYTFANIIVLVIVIPIIIFFLIIRILNIQQEIVKFRRDD